MDFKTTFDQWEIWPDQKFNFRFQKSTVDIDELQLNSMISFNVVTIQNGSGWWVHGGVSWWGPTPLEICCCCCYLRKFTVVVVVVVRSGCVGCCRFYRHKKSEQCSASRHRRQHTTCGRSQQRKNAFNGFEVWECLRHIPKRRESKGHSPLSARLSLFAARPFGFSEQNRSKALSELVGKDAQMWYVHMCDGRKNPYADALDRPLIKCHFQLN